MMKYTAAVLVGESQRLPRKHLKIVDKGKRLIDLVVENLRAAELDVIIYSTYHFDSPAPIILDHSKWIFSAVISILEKLNRSLFIFGGDMPFINKKEIERMAEYTSHNIVVPRWKNGYLEPLHAYYSPKVLPIFRKELSYGNTSLHLAIKKCKDVYYLPAEEMEPETFFNVNTKEDFLLLKKLIKKRDVII